MATRPVFFPSSNNVYLVHEEMFKFPWAPGFAEIQKKKNILALHSAAREKGIHKILEISSKSSEELGRKLSAFSLKIEINGKKYFLESVYQGSKVFENGGPFTEIFDFTPREAKRFIKEKNLGKLIRFELDAKSYPLSPMNAFYDWLYICSLKDHAEWIRRNVNYEAFTDIEFNPAKQVNCQARAFAEYITLLKQSKLSEVVNSFLTFINLIKTI